MEIVLRLPGKYKSPLTKKQFTQEDLDNIYDDFVAGLLLVDLLRKHTISRPTLIYLIQNYYHKKAEVFTEKFLSRANKRLGYKTETYFTEEELLNPQEYTWEGLTKHERLFYKKYERRRIFKKE